MCCARAAPKWDGGYVICGVTGSGDIFTPCAMQTEYARHFIMLTMEIVVLASRASGVQTVFNVKRVQVRELDPEVARW